MQFSSQIACGVGKLGEDKHLLVGAPFEQQIDQGDEADVRAVIRETVSQLGARGPQDMGRVMGAVMPRVKGRVDGGLVNRLVREALGA